MAYDFIRQLLGNAPVGVEAMQPYDVSAKRMEKCKPDYEGMIKRGLDENKRCGEFLEAAISLGKTNLHLGDDLVHIVGRVYIYSREMNNTVQELITLQEKDNTNTEKES